jgi:hypothetical protein
VSLLKAHKGIWHRFYCNYTNIIIIVVDELARTNEKYTDLTPELPPSTITSPHPNKYTLSQRRP